MKLKKQINDYIVISLGSFLVSAGLYFFIMPHNIAAGGVNGVALVINHYIPYLNIGTLMLIMNIFLFILGFIVIGAGFGAKTIYSSLALSGIILILEKLYPISEPLTNDIMLELIIGIIIQGIGMAIIFNKNASTGGTDIIAKIIYKFTHLEIGKALLLTDLVVTLLAALTFGFQKGLYSLLAVVMNGLLIDRAIETFNAHKEIVIISSQKEKIKDFIINDLERGATYYYAKGAFTRKEVEVLSTIVTKREFIRLKSYIREIDPKSFIKVYDVFETLGEGFKNIHE